MAVWSQWLSGRNGCFVVMAVTPRWLFRCDSCPASPSALLARGTAGRRRRCQQFMGAGQMSDTAWVDSGDCLTHSRRAVTAASSLYTHEATPSANRRPPAPK